MRLYIGEYSERRREPSSQAVGVAAINGRRTMQLWHTCPALLDWQYPAFTDYHYQASAQRFEQLAPGSRMDFRLNPGGWTMTLIKH